MNVFLCSSVSRFFGSCGKSRHFFFMPHKTYFVCSPEMEDITRKQPILAYKTAFFWGGGGILAIQSCNCRETVQTCWGSAQRGVWIQLPLNFFDGSRKISSLRWRDIVCWSPCALHCCVSITLKLGLKHRGFISEYSLITRRLFRIQIPEIVKAWAIFIGRKLG